MLVQIELVRHRVENNVMDSIPFGVVVGPIGVTQRKAYLESDSPPKELMCEENSSMQWSDRMAVADDKMKYAVETSLEGLSGPSPDTIFRRGL